MCYKNMKPDIVLARIFAKFYYFGENAHKINHFKNNFGFLAPELKCIGYGDFKFSYFSILVIFIFFCHVKQMSDFKK